MSDSADLQAILLTWASDAATANTNWPGMTAAQKDATTREVIRRLGLFMSNVSEFLGSYRFNNA